MFPNRLVQIGFLALLATALVIGCKSSAVRPIEPPPPDFQATEISYAESDAFDVIFETALIRQDPVIVVRTEFAKPEWGPRLNAWIAAWNQGGPGGGRTVRGQSPLPSIVVDGESIREFRLLVGSLMNRVDDLARNGSAWWSEKGIRSRRIALLKPYNLRFHMDEQQTIGLVFFNGDYARYYPRFMQELTRANDEPEVWTRTFECSQCKRAMTARSQQAD